MDNIKILEEIGLKEVSERTHIEVKHIEYIINSEFDKLNRVNTLGFIKILSREFDIDLSEWLEEAERYWEENTPVDDNPQIFIAQKPSVLPKILYTLLSIVLLIAILYGAYVFLDKKLNFFDKTSSKNDINYTYEQTPVVKEAKKSLQEQNSTTQEKMIVQEESNLNQEETNITVAQGVETNSSIDKKKESLKSEDITENTKQERSDAIEVKKGIVVPNDKLWIGVIYLDDDSRDSFLGEGNYTINLSRDQLITTGHGNFSIHFDDGRVTKFNSQNPMKFMVKDGNLSQISLEKFKELNKGNLW